MSDRKGLAAPLRTQIARALASSFALAVGIGLLTVLVGIDLVTEANDGTSRFHVIVEGSVIAVGIAATLRVAQRVRRLAGEARELRMEAGTLKVDLDATRLEAARWRHDANQLIEGLGTAIDRQLDAWGLSPAEQEVSRLLLKGLSHKEIAQIRRVEETTVRQQAQATYRKAGLSGRNDLAAFFLEDLLAPRSTARVSDASRAR
jgi:DNA-binding CsgD family transcriptional regulator